MILLDSLLSTQHTHRFSSRHTFIRFFIHFFVLFSNHLKQTFIMKFAAGLALASLAAAAPAVQKRGPTPLDVKLEMLDNSKVKAIVTNNGKNNLKVLKTGTFLDTVAVEKAQVFSNGMLSLKPT